MNGNAGAPGTGEDPGDCQVRRATPSAVRCGLVVFMRLLVVVAALAVATGIGLGWLLQRAVVDNVTTLPTDLFDGLPSRPAEPPGAADPVTALLIGSDRRIGRDTGGGVTGQRADSLMMVRLSGDRSHVDVLALPRDAWVSIPGHGEAKINASLSFGGVPLVVQTVEGLTGLRIDHVLIADFTAIREVTTELGGVTVTNPVATTDPQTGTRFEAGRLVLTGDRALTWVRQRYGLPGGDLDRIVHQQQLLVAIGAEITATDVIHYPGTLHNVVQTMSRHLTVDSGLTVQRMTELVADLAATPREAIRLYIAPIAGNGRSPDGQIFLRIDQGALTAACAAIGADQPVPLPVSVLPPS